MEQERKILFVIDHLRVGGAQESLYQWVRYLHTHWQVTVYSLLCDDCALYIEKLQNAGAHVVCLATTRREAWHILPRLITMVLREKFDLAVTLLQRSFAVMTPLCASVKLPNVHILMANHLQTEPWYFPLMRLYSPFVTAFLTYDWVEAVRQHLPLDKVKFVELPFDITPFAKIQHNPQQEIAGISLSGRYPVLLSVGRLHPDKGHQLAIRVVKELQEFYPRVVLVIVGDGSYKAQLQELVRRLDLEEYVVFAGTRTDLDALFARGDVFLRTFLKEGSNTTLSWAMTAGIPIVGFKTETSKDFLVHEVSGLVVPLGDVKAMAQAVKRILEDASLRGKVTEQAREQMLAHYDLNRILALYDQIFVDIANHKKLTKISDVPDLQKNRRQYDNLISND